MHVFWCLFKNSPGECPRVTRLLGLFVWSNETGRAKCGSNVNPAVSAEFPPLFQCISSARVHVSLFQIPVNVQREFSVLANENSSGGSFCPPFLQARFQWPPWSTTAASLAFSTLAHHLTLHRCCHLTQHANRITRETCIENQMWLVNNEESEQTVRVSVGWGCIFALHMKYSNAV